MKNMLENTYTLENGITEHKTYEQAMAGIDETLKKMGLYLSLIHISEPTRHVP